MQFSIVMSYIPTDAVILKIYSYSVCGLQGRILTYN